MRPGRWAWCPCGRWRWRCGRWWRRACP
ncbi:hypothetical protein ACFW1F_05060 [Streptomyces bungoensis]